MNDYRCSLAYVNATTDSDFAIVSFAWIAYFEQSSRKACGSDLLRALRGSIFSWSSFQRKD